MRSRFLAVGGPVGLAAVMLMLFLLLLSPGAGQAAGEPPLTRTESSSTFTFHTAPITSSTTTNTASPLNSDGSENANQVDFWTGADVFVTTAFSGTGTITVTAQFSADGINWAASTYNWPEADSLETGTHRVIHSAAATSLMRLPVAGRYMRFSMVTGDIGANERITPTVSVTFRN